MTKFVFGPVPSRRLGQSLGVDPVPLKTCNWNCVYCQLGRSRPLTNQRREYTPAGEVLAQLREALEAHPPGGIDWVTFVGSGETTLHARLGHLVEQAKRLTPLPVAVITNGSLLYLPEVRRELLQADAVLPSLDAGSEALYRRINRPHPQVPFARHIEGLRAFRREYGGKYWVEVMLVGGLNDTEEALGQIAALLEEIHPDEVHILQPTRPPVETWVQPPDEAGMERALSILGRAARVVGPSNGTFELDSSASLVDAIVDIITRHPMKESELVETLAHFPNRDVRATLEELEKSGQARVVLRHGTRFWSASGAYYPEGSPGADPQG